MDEKEILNILGKNEVFKSCNFEELHEIFKQSSLIKYEESRLIIKEGDLADSLYLILSGSVQVFSTDGNDELVVLARLDEEQLFGEQAYLNNLIRTASVRALTAVELIKISYDILDKLFKRSEQLRKYLENISLDLCLSNLIARLKPIESYVKELFLKKSFFSSKNETSIQRFKKGEIIFKKGDEPDLVYFVSIGSICLSFDENPENSLIINKDEMFGEVGVMHSKPRHATATAFSDVTLIAVSGKNFLKAIKKANSLKSMVVAFNQVYELPKSKAIVEQFLGNFEGNQAIFTKYKLQNGAVALYAKIIDQAIFTAKIIDYPVSKTLSYKKGDFIQRSVFLNEDKIVGLTVFGEWDQVNILSSMLLEGITISGYNDQDFAETGSLVSLPSNSEINKNQDIICNCMSVSYETLKNKIAEGCKQLVNLSEETGACTACGSCRDKILDILGQSSWMSATLQLNEKYGEDIASFKIKPLYSQFIPFISGQYIILKIKINGLWIQRAYTLVSPQNNADHYEVIIKRNSGGAFSPWLFEHSKENLFIWVSLPNGKFVLDKPQNKSILGFAGGIGITPFIAFLRGLKSEDLQQFYIFYAVHNEESAVIPEDIRKSLRIENNIHIEIWDSSKKGLIDEKLIEKIVKQNAANQVYLCGPDSFMNLIVEQLQKMNFPSQNIFKELFLPAG